MSSRYDRISRGRRERGTDEPPTKNQTPDSNLDPGTNPEPQNAQTSRTQNAERCTRTR